MNQRMKDRKPKPYGGKVRLTHESRSACPPPPPRPPMVEPSAAERRSRQSYYVCRWTRETDAGRILAGPYDTPAEAERIMARMTADFADDRDDGAAMGVARFPWSANIRAQYGKQ